MRKMSIEIDEVCGRMGETHKVMEKGIFLNMDQFESFIETFQYCYSAFQREWINKKKLQNETKQRLINNVMSKLRYIKEQTVIVYECNCLNPIVHVKPEEMKDPYCTIYLENENKD